MSTLWQYRTAQRLNAMGSSIIRELLKLTEQPDIISFAGGLPAPEVFPVAAFDAATSRVLAEHGSQALQYATTEGYRPLREFLVEKMAAYGIRTSVDNILITSGAQQAIDIIGRILLNPGDHVLTEEPTFIGALQAWRAYQAQFVTAPIDQDGIRIERLEEAVCAGPKFMYILPNFQNPGGVTLSLERRLALLDVADRYGIPVVEDDPYGELRYAGEHVPPLIVLDSARRATAPSAGSDRGYTHGNVIYLSTFSKTLAPGLRLGWMVAPKPIIELAVKAKQGMDLHTSSFIQMVAYEVVRDGFLREHVRDIRRLYTARRDLMLEMMRRYFPASVRWTEPEGGLFLWVTLPPVLDATELLDWAVRHKVAYVPGTAFYPNGGGHNTLRLNFSNAQPEQIEVGIRRLGTMLYAALDTIGSGPHEVDWHEGDQIAVGP